MTTNAWYFDDEALLGELRYALPSGPPATERMLAAARGAFVWRTIDSDLERLSISSDSLLTGAHLVRSAATVAPRRLLFEGETLGIDVEISERSITGQVLPVQNGTIELLDGTGSRFRGDIDEFGCFVVDRPVDGSVRLRCSTASAGFLTDWITL